MKILVQTEDFDVSSEIAAVRASRSDIGAIASFIGYVRDTNLSDGIKSLHLEHYPGMTESAIAQIAHEAMQRWQILDCTIIHRFGDLSPADQIVLVITASTHRADAFAACDFIMDYLKTRAPFWKKEVLNDGSTRWVKPRSSDKKAAKRWK